LRAPSSQDKFVEREISEPGRQISQILSATTPKSQILVKPSKSGNARHPKGAGLGRLKGARLALLTKAKMQKIGKSPKDSRSAIAQIPAKIRKIASQISATILGAFAFIASFRPFCCE